MCGQKPKIECPETVVRRFSEFVKSVSKEMMGGIMWDTQMSMLFGNEEMRFFTKDEAFREKPQLEREFLEAYQGGGLSRLKAVFIERLYQTPNAKNLGGIVNAIEKILAFE